MKKYSAIIAFFAVSSCFGALSSSSSGPSCSLNSCFIVPKGTSGANLMNFQLTSTLDPEDSETEISFPTLNIAYRAGHNPSDVPQSISIPTLNIADCVNGWVKDWVDNNHIPELEAVYWKKTTFDFIASCFPLAVFLACKERTHENIALVASLYSVGLGFWMTAHYQPQYTPTRQDKSVVNCINKIKEDYAESLGVAFSRPYCKEHNKKFSHNEIYVCSSPDNPNSAISKHNAARWKEFSKTNWQTHLQPALVDALAHSECQSQYQYQGNLTYKVGALAALAAIAYNSSIVRNAAPNVLQTKVIS